MLSRPWPRSRHRSRHARRQRDDEGSFLVIWVLAVVSILLFAALAIDLGNVVQTKQHARNAADAAAVSAVGDLAYIGGGGSAASSEASAVTDAESYVEKNDGSVTSTDWTDPAKCPVGSLPAGVTPSTFLASGSNCIGFFNPTDSANNTSDPTGIAVAVPGRTVKFTLGKVGGQTGQNISAVAEASIQNPGSGYLLPFGYSATGGQGEQCLKTGSGNVPCTGFATGNGQFSMIDSPRYVDCWSACPASSNAAGNNPVVMTDTNLGIDHRLNTYSSGQVICDSVPSSSGCDAYNNASPFDTADYTVPLTGQTLLDPAAALFNADQHPFSISGSQCTISTPRFSHSLGFQASDNCAQDNPTPNPPTPWLSSTDSFGSTDHLDGVQISAYFYQGQNNSLWQQCYQGDLNSGGTALDPTKDPLDETTSGGTNVWAAGDACLSQQLQNPTNISNSVDSNHYAFDAAIWGSPRFGLVPTVTPSNGSNPEQITAFLGVYLGQAFGKNANNKNGTVDAMVAWIFPLSLIQPKPVGNTQGVGSYSGGAYVANLCSLATGNC